MAEDLEKRLAEIESMLSKVKFWGEIGRAHVCSSHQI